MEEINITEKTKLAFSLSQWWAFISTLVIACVWLTALQLNTNYKIDVLNSRTIVEHQETMSTLDDMVTSLKFYVLKSKVEDIFVYYDKYRINYNKRIPLNDSEIQQEKELRDSIREILNR